MMLASLIFYAFAGILTLSALMVITARNPVHSVLFLILAFFNAAGLFIMLGAEFIAMILVIVYVGAVAVLFLFVVMMLDIDFAALRKGARKYTGIGAALGLVLLSELVLVFQTWSSDFKLIKPKLIDPAQTPVEPGITNTELIGRVLYTDYVYVFQGAGLILLVAMIGAIVLTLRHRPDVKRQHVANQQARNPRDVLEIKKVTTGAGI